MAVTFPTGAGPALVESGWWLALTTLSGACAALVVAAFGLRLARRFRETLGARASLRLRQMFVFVDSTRLLHANLLIALVAAVVAGVVGGRVLAAIAGAVAAAFVPALLLAWMRRRRCERLLRQWPDALLLLAGALRAGASLSQAVAQAAADLPSPSRQEFEMIAREQRLGVSLAESTISLQRRAPLPDVGLFCAAVRIASETGGNLAEVLESLAEAQRRRVAIEDRIRALTAQGRLQAWVMAALPIAVAAALFAIDPRAMEPLVATPLGIGVCGGVLVMNALGLYFIRRIAAVDV